jgi:putative flippase GtrA
VSARFVRYLLVGLGTNLALLGAFGLLVWLGLPALLVTALIYVLGIMISYLVNRNWAFASSARHIRAVPRYVAACGLGFVVSMLGTWVFHDVLGWPPMPDQLGVMLVSAMLIFWSVNAHAFPQGEQPGRTQ